MQLNCQHLHTVVLEQRRKKGASSNLLHHLHSVDLRTFGRQLFFFIRFEVTANLISSDHTRQCAWAWQRGAPSEVRGHERLSSYCLSQVYTHPPCPSKNNETHRLSARHLPTGNKSSQEIINILLPKIRPKDMERGKQHLTFPLTNTSCTM